MATLTHFRATAWIVAFALAALVLLPLTAQAQAPSSDDAGSGRDAGDDFATAVAIEPGVIYTASLQSQGPGNGVINTAGDDDWFAFPAQAGQSINAEVIGTIAGGSGCAEIIAPDGSVIGTAGCTGSMRAVQAPVGGTYALAISFPFVDQQAYELAIGLDASAPTGADMGTPSGSAGAGQVVVAVADSGVNPYHEIYHRPENTAHPCTWVEGFDDCSIPALNLSIGEYDTFAEAYEADREIWESLELHQWYWIPGTNIIGAVCEGSESAADGGTGVCIIDENSHGTGTTSAVLTEAPDALLLVHEGNAGAYDLATAPVVPDIQSHSWSAAAPLPLHASDPALAAGGFEQQWSKTGVFHEETVRFIAAGNEALFPTIVDYTKVDPEVQVVGGGYPGFWTPLSWTVYDFASWYCRPTAAHDDIKAYRAHMCGTSFAAPTVAGTAAAALSEIRRREGTNMRSTVDMVSESVSRDDFIAALRSGATYEPQAGRFRNQPAEGDQAIVDGAEHLSWGYGWLDRTRVDAIVACALDDVCPAKSAEAEQYNTTRQEFRRLSTGGLPTG